MCVGMKYYVSDPESHFKAELVKRYPMRSTSSTLSIKNHKGILSLAGQIKQIEIIYCLNVTIDHMKYVYEVARDTYLQAPDTWDFLKDYLAHAWWFLDDSVKVPSAWDYWGLFYPFVVDRKNFWPSVKRAMVRNIKFFNYGRNWFSRRYQLKFGKTVNGVSDKVYADIIRNREMGIGRRKF